MTTSSAKPTHSDALPFFPRNFILPRIYILANFLDHAGNFMSGNSWVLNTRPKAFLEQHVAMADATSLDFDAHPAGFRRSDRTVNQIQCAACLAHLNGFQFRFPPWFMTRMGAERNPKIRPARSVRNLPLHFAKIARMRRNRSEISRTQVCDFAGREIRELARVWHNGNALEWRNWQTHGTKNHTSKTNNPF